MNNTDGVDTQDTDLDTDVDPVDTDTQDTDLAGADTAFESDTDTQDTDVTDTDSGTVLDPDDDGDGYAASVDCNDDNTAVNPGATEVCNQTDDDCDTQIDEGTNDGLTYYRDSDGDLYGSPTATTRGCGAPVGFVADGTDCADSVFTTHPDAPETCNGVDDDCDTNTDEDPTDGSLFYLDDDGDDYGNSAFSTNACSAPDGYVDDATDCDDGETFVHPGAAEVCNQIDDNCANGVDEGVKTTYYLDGDFDDYGDAFTTTAACSAPDGYVADATDCDDEVDTTHPDATELCNGVNDNCVGGIDEGVKTTFFRDADSDNYGNASLTALGCVAPSGYVADATDCDDALDFIHPDAPETDCTDPIDYNCDGSTGFADADNDSVPACQDCDDNNEDVFPGAVESCNGVDDDCDTDTDEGLTSVFYRDSDADTFGNVLAPIDACSQPAGYVANASDCDDVRDTVRPNATEVCNLRDDNCVNGIDEGVKLTFYEDGDSDLYGNAGASAQGCVAPSGYVADGTDCNDGATAVNPGATEVCNSIDDDCDTAIDEGVKTSFFADTDNDTYGDVTSSLAACSAPNGYVTNATDCDDDASAVHPGVTEVCNGIDDNCVGGADEGVKLTYYLDADSDLYGDATSPAQGCTLPNGYTFDDTDCDDDVSTTHPNATEVCNGVDDDCDTTIDEGVKLRFYVDADSDLYGDAQVSQLACTAPSGFVVDKTDCNDAVSTTHPNATELCNGVDDDCSTVADDHISPASIPLANRQAGVCIGAKKVCGGVAGFVEPDFTTIAFYEATESSCDGRDNDCDSAVDEGLKDTFYADVDDDNFGDAAISQLACVAPPNFVANADDCDDLDDTINPDALEVCDETDNDCNTLIDDAPIDASDYFVDVDQDGFGAGTATASCNPIAGSSPFDGDCADDDVRLYPGAPELCDGLQNDCDAPSWTSADEAGLVSVEQPSGGWLDITAAFTGNVTLSGGTVHVCEGTWPVALSATTAGSKAVVGEGNPSLIVLSGSDTHRVLTQTAGDVRLADLTVDSGTSAADGGCVQVSGGRFRSTNVTFQYCYAGTDGGAISVASGATATLETTTVAYSDALLDGGGIWSAGALTISGSAVHDNDAGQSGGGLYTSGVVGLNVNTSTFERNTSAVRGGNVALVDGTALLHDVKVYSGFASVSGGGIHADNVDLALTECDVASNEASADGGGVAVVDGTLDMWQVSVRLNVAAGPATRGGGIHVQNSPLTMENTTVSENSALDATHAVSLTSRGGGIAADASGVLLKSSSVSSCLAGLGGGVWLDADAGPSAMTLTGLSNITRNTALRGGGLFVSDGLATCGTGAVGDASIMANQATGQDDGAGVFLDGATANLSLLSCDLGDTVTDNTAGGFTNQDVTTSLGTTPFGAYSTAECNGATGCNIP